MTLLDEQLDASASYPQRGLAGSSPAQAVDAEAATPNRVAAQYAEAATAFRPDAPTQQSAFAPDTTNQQMLLAAASPELRMAMQSAFVSAAVRAQAEDPRASDSVRRRQAGGATGAVMLRVGAGVIAAIALLIVLALKYAH
ncbi:MAG: hypothetical protein QM780_13715 [Hyphomicrobium sp.]|uniref:hypothetical protein n=1 Tax=Hyphomicrobium sp. TaxID=82 RepID=UPI0039E52D64